MNGHPPWVSLASPTSKPSRNQTSPYHALFNSAEIQFSECPSDNPGEHSYYI